MVLLYSFQLPQNQWFLHYLVINFGVFSKPLPEATFGGPKRRSITKSAICNRFWLPAGLQNGPFERNFRPKRRQGVIAPNYLLRPETGCDLAPKMLKVEFGMDFGTM